MRTQFFRSWLGGAWAHLVLIVILVDGRIGYCADEENGFATHLSAPGKLEIVRHPAPADYLYMKGHGKLASVPSYDSNSKAMWQVDLRSSDLSALDLSGRLEDLRHADFDSKTKWPATLPKGFDPSQFMKLGMNPGLGIRALHRQGITGKGIGIAIIDQALLVDHEEYGDRLKLYEEIRWHVDSPAQMHAPAVASIAVGKNVGVAPDADLYFIAEWHSKPSRLGFGDGYSFWLPPLAQSIDRIVEINRTLPQEHRIRVLSISLGINPRMDGYKLVEEAIAKANQEGIYVVYVGDSFSGLGRTPTNDPEVIASYGPGHFYGGRWPKEAIWVPMDSRCVASPTGKNDYVFYNEGGMSWTVPWVAGLYALACQVKPDVTPEVFWNSVRTTGLKTKIEINGKTAEFGLIINPAGLLKDLQSQL